ncbi:diguanylate cyclase [Salinisphaera sp. T5B8]|uniref:GGDEF domain-containing protein n=1 Tax=Salinisphaera sp. T5B8 TaxID=1304154 RepID=UPI003341B636
MSVDEKQSGRFEAGKLSWLLQFPEPIEARYEAAHGRQRVATMRASIVVGLLIYNLYNITSVVLLPDILWSTVAVRVLGVTVVAVVFAVCLDGLSARWRERLALISLLGAALLPIGFYWVSNAAYAGYTVGEFGLMLAYGNMLLCLRFVHALVFTAVHVSVTLLAFDTKPGGDPGLQFAFSLQVVSAAIFTLYANYRTERQRCTGYLTALAAWQRSANAESVSQRYKTMSRTDSLTGLLNRRALDEELQRWFRGSRRPQEAGLAVIMLDIDHFKPYNDCLGHPAGDRCLGQVAKVLRSISARHGALCTRFGGEEFVIVVFDIQPGQAQAVADELADGVRALDIPHPARPDGKHCITVSVGVAMTRPGGGSHDADSLLAAADEALYSAKDNGRDRIEFPAIA